MNIKKVLTGLSAFIVALSIMVVPAFAKVETVPGSWAIQTGSQIDFSCGGSYIHTLDTIVEEGDGDISGTGHYNSDPAYTWDLTGHISGDAVTIHILYTGTSAGSMYTLTGTFNADGSISGEVDSNCQTFSMPAGSAVQSSGNHGQYVRSQENKKEAAQSRIGMPVQSKGHTK